MKRRALESLVLCLSLFLALVMGCEPASSPPKPEATAPADQPAATQPAPEQTEPAAAAQEKVGAPPEPTMEQAPTLVPSPVEAKPEEKKPEPPKEEPKAEEAKPEEKAPAKEPEKAAAKEPTMEQAPVLVPPAVEAKPEEKKPEPPKEEPKAEEAKPEEKAPAKEPEKTAAKEPPQAAPAGEKLEVKVPAGLPPLPVPADNPMTVEKVELGKMLYFDKRVSLDNSISCATCHDPKMAWAELEATSVGIHKQRGGRNSPTVINAAYAPAQFWDGRAETLEEQAVGPVANAIEMGHNMQGVVDRFAKIPGYQEMFQKVFGTGVTEKGFAQAVAAFERTVLSGDSPYDRYTAGDKDALNEAQKRGLALFEKNCASCHKPPLFSNYRYLNAGVGMDKPKPDEGRKDVTGKDSDLGRFRVPPLREVANTAPYFHDGSAATLEDAVALMAAGGKENSNLSSQMRALGEAKLTADNQKDLVEFLKALSGKFPVIEPPTTLPQ